MAVVLYVIAVLLMVGLLSVFLPKLVGAGWSPTSMEAVHRMLEVAELKPGDLLYDLGCGDGRILLVAAKKHGSRCVGIEIDPFRYLISRIRVKWAGLSDRVRVVWGNFFDYDISTADVVTIFLSPSGNKKLKVKLEAELKPRARVISYVWPVKGWKPKIKDYKMQVYLYQPTAPAGETGARGMREVSGIK